MIIKNRERSFPSFANINLLGQCNANCFFCLGKDLPDYYALHNQLNTHFSEWKNFDNFLARCADEGVYKLYITGQTADGLQYCSLATLIVYLQDRGFEVGVRTNGYLAERKMNIIKMMDGGIGYSIHSLNPNTNYRIMGHQQIPDWKSIIPQSGDKVRISIVVNRYNIGEFYDLVDYISQFKNVRYIQARRISTDTRLDDHVEDIELYEELFQEVNNKFYRLPDFYAAQRYVISNKEVCFWRTVETTVNSINYFTDGTVSNEYFIVEGYLKNQEK